MDRTPNFRCTLASLVALVVFVSFPVRSGCEEDAYKPLTEAECCGREEGGLKRFNDVDYDSFVGLMGRRSAGQPPEAGPVDFILADLFGLKPACPHAEECVQKRRGRVNSHRRFQRLL